MSQSAGRFAGLAAPLGGYGIVPFEATDGTIRFVSRRVYQEIRRSNDQTRDTEGAWIVNSFGVSCRECQAGQLGQVVEAGVEPRQGVIQRMRRGGDDGPQGRLQTV